MIQRHVEFGSAFEVADALFEKEEALPLRAKGVITRGRKRHLKIAGNPGGHRKGRACTRPEFEPRARNRRAVLVYDPSGDRYLRRKRCTHHPDPEKTTRDSDDVRHT